MEKWEGKVAVVTGASGGLIECEWTEITKSGIFHAVLKKWKEWNHRRSHEVSLWLLIIVGIGAQLCKALVEAGMIVCGMSKRKDKMEVNKNISSVSWCVLKIVVSIN